jgi:hypothetical protein
VLVAATPATIFALTRLAIPVLKKKETISKLFFLCPRLKFGCVTTLNIFWVRFSDLV